MLEARPCVASGHRRADSTKTTARWPPSHCLFGLVIQSCPQRDTYSECLHPRVESQDTFFPCSTHVCGFFGKSGCCSACGGTAAGVGWVEPFPVVPAKLDQAESTAIP